MSSLPVGHTAGQAGAGLGPDSQASILLSPPSLSHRPLQKQRRSIEGGKAETQVQKREATDPGARGQRGRHWDSAWGRGTAVPRGPVVAHVLWEDTMKVAASWLQAAEDTSVSSVGATVSGITNPGGGLKR